MLHLYLLDAPVEIRLWFLRLRKGFRMPTYQNTTDQPSMGAYPVIGKPTAPDNWQIISVETTEAAAELVAAQKVVSPDNFFAARVCKPKGDLFLHSA